MHTEPSAADNSQERSATRGGRRISLVLGSGGARGLAHIGVVRELEARGYRIEAITGCSMGALVGGLYALGKLEEYADWVSGLEWSDVLRLLDLTGSPGGFIAGEKIMGRLHRWLGDTRIEDLPIPYIAVAVDLEREREVWMSEGSLYDAIRASISIPGVFTPHTYRGRQLVDGGVLNPIPVAPSIHHLTDQTFVVDANGPPVDLGPWRRKREAHNGASDADWLSRALAKLGWGARRGSAVEKRLDVVTVLTQSLDTMQAALTRQHLAVFHPDEVFRVPRNLCDIHEFHRASEIIDMGREVAQRTLDRADGDSF